MNDSQPPSAQKILVIRFSSIGDIVLTTPIVRAIKQQIPGVSVHFLVKKGFEIIVQDNPYIDKVHIYEKGNSATLAENLKAEHFDFVVDLQKNYRSRKLVKKLHCPHSTFSKCNIRKAILVRTKINFLPNRHIVDRYFDAVKKLGVTNDGMGLDYFIPDSDRFDVQDLPAGFEEGYIAVAIGANHNTKRMPTEKIIEIGNLLFKPMVLLGNKQDRAAGDEIVRQMNGKALNLCGEHNLNTSASILEQSACVLTGDTGLMHIAAALHKPITSLWGNTVPELGMYPYTTPDAPECRIFEIPFLKCRPCSKLGFNKCPHKHFKCMNLISSYEVADWINKF